MSRPVRIEFSSALYHVTAHSDQREEIFASQSAYPHGHIAEHFGVNFTTAGRIGKGGN